MDTADIRVRRILRGRDPLHRSAGRLPLTSARLIEPNHEIVENVANQGPTRPRAALPVRSEWSPSAFHAAKESTAGSLC
jgi:hypothetical protein